MNRSFFLILFVSIFQPMVANVAMADLSQLEFDSPKSSVERPRQRPIVLRTPTVISQNDSPEAEKASSRARLANPSLKSKDSGKEKISLNKEFVGKEFNFEEDSKISREILRITPRLKGPLHDKGSVETVTSRYSWKPRKGSCGAPASKAEHVLKGKALREVLFRYSGKNDFYDSLTESVCAPGCSGEGVKAWTTGLALKSAQGGEFSFDQSDAACRYRLTKPSESDWKLLESSKVVCACVNGSK